MNENSSISEFLGALKTQEMKEILFPHLESLKITGGAPLSGICSESDSIKGVYKKFGKKWTYFADGGLFAICYNNQVHFCIIWNSVNVF